MTEDICKPKELLIDITRLSEGEREEMIKLGILSEENQTRPSVSPLIPLERPPIQKRAVHASEVLNEAYDYFPRASSFSRGLRIDIRGFTILLISGTASVDENGNSVHIGDFRAQCWRTYRNITALLDAEEMTWHDVVRTRCYLRDIERDYRDFNEVRTAYFQWLELDPLPASTGIQARLCREDLLVEIEAIAVRPSNPE
jgi:enamine deaminase RidA (YjgF/YER057c/UK114 family)